MDKRIEFGFYTSCRNRGMLDVCLWLGCGDVGGVGGDCVGWGRILGPGLEWWGGVMPV